MVFRLPLLPFARSPRVCLHARACTRAHAPTHAHVHTPPHAHTRVHTCTRSHTYTLTHTCTLTYTCTLTHVHVHVCIQHDVLLLVLLRGPWPVQIARDSAHDT